MYSIDVNHLLNALKNQEEEKSIQICKTNFKWIVVNNFKVAVRVRPPINTKEEKCIQVFSKKSLYFDDGHNKPKKYMYDYVFAEDSTQDEVYQTTTSPLIKDVLKGYSAAVFAYGATGSGNEHAHKQTNILMWQKKHILIDLIRYLSR